MKYNRLLPVAILLIFNTFQCNGCLQEIQDKYSDSNYYSKYGNEEDDDKNIVDYINNRTVRVVIKRGFYDKNGKFLREAPLGWGSGTVIHSGPTISFVQTAYHVVRDIRSKKTPYRDGYYICNKIELESRRVDNSVRTIFKNVTVYKYNEEIDIALLRVPTNMRYSSVVSKQDNYISQRVVCTGFPSLLYHESSNLSFSRGYISSINIDNNGKVRIIMDAYFGSSGSAIWDKKGRIIGMVTEVAGFYTLNGYSPKSVWGPGIRSLRSFYASIGFVLPL